ncbi:helix-turn-helix domain-containing protein [Streptomyces sp. NPDC001492]
MGRRERPIAPCDRELEKLVSWLRCHRARAGLSYKQLAAGSGCSASTLVRAASGEQVPKLKVVRAYAVAAGADPGEGERLWKRARYRAVRADEEPAPHPRYVRDFAGLRAALVDLYQKDGARPCRELEEASGKVLAHATVSRFLRQEGGRPTRAFVLAFAEICGARGMALQEWGQAWDRAEERRVGGTPKSEKKREKRTAGVFFALIPPDGTPVFVRSDPQRTPDGQEVRRVTAAAPSEIPNYMAHVRTLKDLFAPKVAPATPIRYEDLIAARARRRALPLVTTCPWCKTPHPVSGGGSATVEVRCQCGNYFHGRGRLAREDEVARIR